MDENKTLADEVSVDRVGFGGASRKVPAIAAFMLHPLWATGEWACRLHHSRPTWSGDGNCAGIGGCNAAARSADKAVGGAQQCAFPSAEWTPPGRKEVALVMVAFMPPQDMLPTYFNSLVIARVIYTNVLLL